ncbi:MAG: Cys-tRNA(Pro) deacylase [Nannocystaceae bacterium]|nr:Cys-tRNA(Pro) deacylase [Nannocystaceae bacterium]
MAKPNLPVTAAIRVLREHGIAFVPHPYDYQPRGGTAHSAQCLGVDEHAVIKTLIMEDESATPLVVLMHGDRQVSTKALARHLGRKSIQPCTPEVADRHSGYQVGGTSPLGTRRAMPVYIERSILDLPRIYINGGRRGMLVELEPRALAAVLRAEPVDVATGGHGDAPR